MLTSAGAETLVYDSEDPADPRTFFLNGLLRSTTLGVVTDAYTYSSFGEVDNYTAQVSAVDQFVTGFVRDKLGRITQKTENVQGVAHTFDYAYNNAGYLVEVKRDSVVTATYTYDSNGNRLNNNATYDDQDRLVSTNSASYTYTDNGELLTKTEGADVTQYKYDVLGNLLSVTLPSGTLIEYIIDGRNRRIGKKVDGVLQQAWLYKDGLNPIAELDGTGSVVSRFVYASRANIPDYIIKEGITYRIISDHLGSPRLVVNTADGTVAEAIEYDEWGNILSDTNQGFTPFGFAGGLYDLDTKLIRFGARDYNPQVGRWTSKDPIRFDGDGPNLYGYTTNDPINYFDSFGLKCHCPKPPPAPPGVDIDRNIRVAQSKSNPLWFPMMVRSKGPWDYKQVDPQFEDFGNFNYGASGAAFGLYSDRLLLQAAGAFQIFSGTSMDGWSNPFWVAPYGDDPKDQEMIKLGIRYFRCQNQ